MSAQPLDLPVEVRVPLSAELAALANRIAREQHWSLPEAVLFLVKRGARAQREAEHALEIAYNRFMQADAADQEKAGDDLIRAIFGPESLA